MPGNDAYTKLLLHMDGADESTAFTDDSASAHTVTAYGDAQVSTAQSKFGGGSLLSGSVSDYLSIPDSTDLYPGYGDWTVDCWVYLTGAVDDWYMLCRKFDETEYNGWGIEFNPDSGIYFYGECVPDEVYGSGTLNFACYGEDFPGLSLNTWHHLAFVFYDGAPMIFIDGVSCTLSRSIIHDFSYDSDVPLIIGAYSDWDEFLNGYIDEFRISKGVARWTESFIPPVVEYDNSANIVIAVPEILSQESLSVVVGIAVNIPNILIQESFSPDISFFVGTAIIVPEITVQKSLSVTIGVLLVIPEISTAQSFSSNDPVIYLRESINESLAAEDILTHCYILPIIADTFYIRDTVINGLTIAVQEALGLTDAAAAQLCLMIHDYVLAKEAITVNQSGTKTISESLMLNDAAYPALHLSISDTVALGDTSSVMLILEVLEYLWFGELVTAVGILNKSVSDTIDAADSLQFGFSQAVSDVLGVVDVASVIGALLNSITESLVAADAVTPGLKMCIPVSESLSFADTVSSQGVLYNIIYDTLHLNVSVELDGETWECYVLNTPRFLPSVYSGFNFNSYCVFENRAYGCKSDGIYELTGDTDAGVAFHTGVQLSETRFGIPNQKRFMKAYVGVEGTTPKMVMETEDGSKKVYSIDADGEVDASRAIKGKKWKLTVTDFDQLDFIKLYPVVLAK